MSEQIDLISQISAGAVEEVKTSKPVSIRLKEIGSGDFRFAIIAAILAFFVAAIMVFFIYVYWAVDTSPEIRSIIIAGFATAIGTAIGGLFASKMIK